MPPCLKIRLARVSDTEAIDVLLESLGYPNTTLFLRQRIRQLLAHPNKAPRFSAYLPQKHS